MLVLAAVALAGFNMAEDRSAGEAAGNALEQLLLAERDARDAARRASAETPETPAESGGVTLDPVYPDGENAVPEGEMPVIEIDGYGYIGVLQIPSLVRIAFAIASVIMLSSVIKHSSVNSSNSLVLILFHSNRDPTMSPMMAPSMVVPSLNYFSVECISFQRLLGLH